MGWIGIEAENLPSEDLYHKGPTSGKSFKYSLNHYFGGPCR